MPAAPLLGASLLPVGLTALFVALRAPHPRALRTIGWATAAASLASAALLVAARKAGLDEHALRKAAPRLDEIAFDSARQARSRSMRISCAASTSIISNGSRPRLATSLATAASGLAAWAESGVALRVANSRA